MWKTIKYGLFIFVFLSVGINAFPQLKKNWIRNTTVNEIAFSKLRYLIHDGDTTGIIGRTKTDFNINNIPCKKAWVHFNQHWEPILFQLSEAHQVKNVNLPKNSWVRFSNTSEYIIVVFPRDTVINGFPVKGGGGSTGVQTQFYPNGKLRSFFPYKNMLVNNTSIKKSLFHSVTLNEHGEVIIED